MNYYILCKNCKKYSLLKTEYLVFCENCKKKLDTTFQQWQQDNPKGAFEDFKQSIGVSEEALEKQKQGEVSNQNYQKGRIKMLIAIVVVFVILITLLFFLFNFLTDKFF